MSYVQNVKAATVGQMSVEDLKAGVKILGKPTIGCYSSLIFRYRDSKPCDEFCWGFAHSLCEVISMLRFILLARSML